VDFDLLEWVRLGVRWLHLVAGVAWIGASFYFIWLDNSLRPPSSAKPGVGGELWAVHGGGFYHNQKYLVAPEHLPKDLHWFKWEAYTTWLSGFALLALIYYVQPGIHLIDSAKADLVGWQAIIISLASLAGGWLVYDGLCRSPLGRRPAALAFAIFVLLIAAAFGLTRIFSDKGAFVHTGALIGTMMAANVFVIIIPNQKKTVAAMVAGETPDPALGAQAKQRSVHNNYLVLPVLFLMISGHFPMVMGHPLNWLLLAGLSAVSVLIRHFFNLKHQGNMKPALLGAAAAGGVALVVFAAMTAPKSLSAGTSSAAPFSDVRTIIKTHCATCHAAAPSHPAFTAAPGGFLLDSDAAMMRGAPLIYQQTVATAIMPLGNETGMTDEERRTLGAWVDGLSAGEEE